MVDSVTHKVVVYGMAHTARNGGVEKRPPPAVVMSVMTTRTTRLCFLLKWADFSLSLAGSFLGLAGMLPACLNASVLFMLKRVWPSHQSASPWCCNDS